MWKAENFWAKVDQSAGPTGCWPWTKGGDTSGYGITWDGTRRWRTHRLAWLLTNGPIGEWQVLHRCDNRPCCNPAHLFLGDNSANVRDKMEKGRHRAQPFGEGNTRAKLTGANVLLIRERYASGETQTALAREYSMAQSQIGRIVRRERWPHI